MQANDVLQEYKNLVMNTFSVSLTNILYHFQVYPKEAFHLKTVIGLEVQALKQSILLDYVTNLQEQISKLFNYLQKIDIAILQSKTEKLIYECSLDIDCDIPFLQTSNKFSSYERDTNMKSTIYYFLKHLGQQPIEENDLTFNVRFHTNGKETQEENSKQTFLDNWTKMKDCSADIELKKQLIQSINLPGFHLTFITNKQILN